MQLSFCSRASHAGGESVGARGAGGLTMSIRKRLVACTSNEQDFVETEFADFDRFVVWKLGLMWHDGLRLQLGRSLNFITAIARS